MAGIKRAFENIKFYKKRNILLITIFFVLFLILSIAIVIGMAAKTQIKNMEASVGTSIQIQKKGIDGTERNIRGAFDENEITTLIDNDYADSYNIYMMRMGYLADVNPFIADEEKYGEWLKERGKKTDNTDNSMFLGVTDSQTSPLFAGADYHLVRGKPITINDMNKNVILVSDTLAKMNHLKIGDTITIQASHFSRSSSNALKMKIQGIFTYPEQEFIKEYAWRAFYNTANQVVMPQTTLTQLEPVFYQVTQIFVNLKEDSMAQRYVEEMVATLGETVKDEAYFCTDKYTYTWNKNWYNIVSQPLKQIQTAAMTMAFIMAIGVLTIILLVGAWILRGKRKEMGICLALGEKKSGLIIQVLIEEMIPTICAMLLTTVTVSVATPAISGKVLSQSSAKVNEQITQQRERASKKEYGNTDYIMMIDVDDGEFQYFSAPSHLTFKECRREFVIFMLTALGIICFSFVIQINSLLRQKPRVLIEYQE